MRRILEERGLTLRLIEAGDVPRFHRAVRESAAEVGRFMSWCHAEYSLEEAQAWQLDCQRAWDTDSSYPLLITSSASGDVLGVVDINQINREHQIGNLGYWVVSAHAGKGVVTAAARMMARFGLTELGLARLEIVTLVHNAASRRVAEKLGATLECVARNRLMGWGKPHDAAVYSLTPADLGQLKA